MNIESNIWKNWSGSLKFYPKEIREPESEEEICDIVYGASKNKQKIRVVGAGHSSTPLVKSEDILINLKHFKGIENVDLNDKTSIVLSGMTVKEVGSDLFRFGLAMHNTGDVDVQKLAGAIGTGTHGTGVNLQNLSSMLIGVRMVNGLGKLCEYNHLDHPDILRALRVSLGTCGIFLKMKLQLLPAFELQRQEWCAPLKDSLNHLESLYQNRNFDFYWYPRSDLTKLRIMNHIGEHMPEIKYGKLVFDKTGPGHEILPRERDLKFDEMEYALPAENGPKCFMEVRRLILDRFRKNVAWRVLYRTVKSDDTFISPMYGRDTATISLHHNAGLPFWNFFKAVEPIFLKYEGRPHWAKKHTLEEEYIKDLYPEWNSFQNFRDSMDPERTFTTKYMREILGE